MNRQERIPENTINSHRPQKTDEQIIAKKPQKEQIKIDELTIEIPNRINQNISAPGNQQRQAGVKKTNSLNQHESTSLEDLDNILALETSHNIPNLQQQQLDLIFPKITNVLLKEKPIFCFVNTIILYLSMILMPCIYDENKYKDILHFWLFQYVFLPVLVCYIVESCISVTLRYLLNLMTFDEFLKYICMLKERQLKIFVKGKAYHFKKMQKVVTYEEIQQFDYKISQDNSFDLSPFFDHIKIFRLNISVVWSYGNTQAETNFYEQKQKLMQFLKTKDVHVETTDFVKLDLRNRILLYSKQSEKPFLLGAGWYVFFSIIGLSFPYRIYVNSKSGYLDYNLQKSIIC